MRRQRERRGATIVLVVLTMGIIMAFAAFAIDLSRMYAYRSELQRSADAAAHAGAVELSKAGYNTADGVATAYANANAVEGENPTVDSIQYGTWDPAGATFAAICTAPCGLGVAAGANAIRVSLSGGPSAPIFGQFVGQVTSPTSIKVSAIGWSAPTITRHDCSKPFAFHYSDLTTMLNTVEGRAGLSTDRILDSTDLTTLRSGGTNLLQCFTVVPADQCAGGAPPYTGSYQMAQLYPPASEGADPNLYEIEEPCASTNPIGPGDALDTATTIKPGDATTGTDQWCTLYGTDPCLMKLALWDSAAVAGVVATDSSTCSAVSCVRVKAIVPYIVTSVTEGNGNAFPAIEGYPLLGVDEALIGPGPAGPVERVVLVH